MRTRLLAIHLVRRECAPVAAVLILLVIAGCSTKSDESLAQSVNEVAFNGRATVHSSQVGYQRRTSLLTEAVSSEPLSEFVSTLVRTVEGERGVDAYSIDVSESGARASFRWSSNERLALAVLTIEAIGEGQDSDGRFLASHLVALAVVE